MAHADTTPWTLRKWPQRIGLTLVVLIIATPILLVLVIAAQVASDPLGLKGGGEFTPLTPREACREWRTHIGVAPPVTLVPDPERSTREIERIGDAIAIIAGSTEAGRLHDELFEAAQVPGSRVFGSADELRSDPAVLAVAEHCARLPAGSP